MFTTLFQDRLLPCNMNVKHCAALVVGLLFAHDAAAQSASQCPPAGWNTVANLDLRALSAQPWFIQENVSLSLGS